MNQTQEDDGEALTSCVTPTDLTASFFFFWQLFTDASTAGHGRMTLQHRHGNEPTLR